MPNRVLLYSAHVEFEGTIQLTISNLREQQMVDQLRSRPGFLMISVKNKHFSNRLIDAFCRFSERHLAEAYVILVDSPYLKNIVAADTGHEYRERETEKLERISAENHRRVSRILNKNPATRGTLLSWNDVARDTPDWIGDEVRTAFENRGRFYADILERTSEVMPTSTNLAQLEAFSQFLVCEIPVLFDLYYLRHAGGIVDVYPGENPDLIWNIESGYYADELPELSRIAGDSKNGLTYVDFREKTVSTRELKAMNR